MIIIVVTWLWLSLLLVQGIPIYDDYCGDVVKLAPSLVDPVYNIYNDVDEVIEECVRFICTQ